MKILVITQMYSQPDDVGDNKPTKTVNYFVKEWVNMGHSVIVMHCPSKFPLILYKLPKDVKELFASRISTMVPSIESRKELERKENGAIVYRLPMLKVMPGQGYSASSMQKQTAKITKILERNGFVPDIVIGHFANPSLELVARIAEKYNAKSSIVFHHDCTDANIKKYRIQENIDRVGAIGVRSVVEAHEVKERLCLQELPFICCSGVPNDAVQAAQKICDKQDFSLGIKHIYVGSLIKRKHLDVVIKAFNNVRGENDTLIVVGGGPEEEPLKALADELKAENVIFTGRVSREDVLRKMEESQVFTLISDSEVYGMVYIEAMLQGCLTIASKGGGFDGIIQDGVNGFICEPGNQEELEEIYRRISCLTTEERNMIGQAAIDTAIHYSEREVAERYLDDILNNQR